MAFDYNSASAASSHGATIDPKLLVAPNPTACIDPKGGKGAVHPAIVTNAIFLATLFPLVNGDEAIAVCSKPGSPEVGGWAASPLADADQQCPPTSNNYFNCSTFSRREGEPFRAAGAQFNCCQVIVLDDVGTKVPEARLGDLVPTWKLETSPGNFQVGLALSEPIKSQPDLRQLQQAIVEAGLCDPGASGVARWARLPVGVNGKDKYRSPDGSPFSCSLVAWNPQARFTVEELVGVLGLSLKQSVADTRREITAAAAPSSTDDVCSYPTTENPVITALRQAQLYKREIARGKHDITCPWVHEHTDQLDTGAAYFEPDANHPRGGFCCQHSHGDSLSIGELISYLGVSSEQAQNKPVIRLIPGALNRVLRAAEQALARTGRIFQAGHAIVRLTQAGDGDLATETLNEQSLARELGDAAIWQYRSDPSKPWVTVDPSPKYVTALLKSQRFEVLPRLKSLARQPFIRAEDDQLVIVPGYDPESGTYAAFDGAAYGQIAETQEAAEAALGRLEALLSEFSFASDADRSSALCGMLTAALRPSLPTAPAFNITAPTSGSGKSFLAELLSRFASSAAPATASYPTSQEEASKLVLSLLVSGPACINFDDMTEDWRAYAAINRMLTSETMSERVLGTSRMAQVGTRCFVLGSGNNVHPVNDLKRRVLSVRLRPQSANPALSRYTNNPVQELKASREAYVTDAFTIVSAYRAAGSPAQTDFDVGGFGTWSKLCREPLIWLGLPDPAAKLREQVTRAFDDEDHADLLTAWHQLLGDQPVTVRRLLEVAATEEGKRLRQALEDLPVSDAGKINPGKLGWYLKKHTERIVQDHHVEPAQCSERKAWRVVQHATASFTSFPAPAPEADTKSG